MSAQDENSVLENISADQLRDHRRDAELQIPLLSEDIRMDRHVLSLDCELDRQRANLHDLAVFRPIGKVTLLLFLLAYQFTSMLGEVPTDQPAAGK